MHAERSELAAPPSVLFLMVMPNCDGQIRPAFNSGRLIAWTAVSDRGLGSGNIYSFVYGMIEFKGQLYAGIGNWTNGGVGGQVWRCTLCNGTDWAKVVDNGFGSADNAGIANFAVFNNVLYATTFNLGKGVEIWRSASGDSTDWAQVVSAGNGDANTFDAYPTAANGYLYAAVENSTDGMEIWRTDNGTTWNRISTGGFGDATNNQYNRRPGGFWQRPVCGYRQHNRTCPGLSLPQWHLGPGGHGWLRRHPQLRHIRIIDRF